MSTAIIQRATVMPLEFTDEQKDLIRNSFLNGASDSEIAVLMEIARIRRLNPITKQIHFVKRWDKEKNCFVWSAQTGIDGFRSIAERTGLYDGQDEPTFEYVDKRLLKATVRVYRKDWSRPAVGVAFFPEFAQRRKDGSLTSFWAEKPHVMLAKCSEAQALRKAFPEDTGGLYIPEEMEDEESGTPIAGVRAPLPPQPPKAPEPAKASPGRIIVHMEDAEMVPSPAGPAGPGPTQNPQNPHNPQADESAIRTQAEELEKIIATAQTKITLSKIAGKVRGMPEPEKTKLMNLYTNKAKELR